MRFRAVGGHVRIPAEGALALGLGRLEHGGRIGVLEQHVRAAIDQRGRGFRFFWRVKPAIDPDHLGLDLGVAALRAQGKAIDVADHFGNRDRRDHAQRVGLGHLAGDHAGHVGAFIGAAVVGAHVRGRLVASGMLELDTVVVGSNLEHGLHVAKRGAENQLIALTGEVADHALGVRRLGHVLDKRRDHLVAELCLDGLAAVVVCKGPAAVTDRADVGKGNFERNGFGRWRWNRRPGHGHGHHFFFLAAPRQRGGGHDAEGGCFQQRTFLQISHVKSSFLVQLRRVEKIRL